MQITQAIKTTRNIIFSLLFFPIFATAHSVGELDSAYIDKVKNQTENKAENQAKKYKPRTKHLNKDGGAKYVNHLILESSPYLLQHAHNPVNWFAFSDEAFALAKKTNKPIFISIGYATCHWCHVMEEESFDDLEVAKFINQHFVAIKVDREILPDVDASFMRVAQLINGSGGWPLNAVLLPNGKAFLAVTYLPKEQLLALLGQVQEVWQKTPSKIINQANEISEILTRNQVTKYGNANSNIDKSIILKSTADILKGFDEFEGGFGRAPKFPHESTLLLLIDEQKRNPDIDKLNSITVTLDNMASGGIYDVIGGGFHRYATDNAWLFPHFEKMLYNQAGLSLVYTRAYQLTKNPLYKRVAKQTLDYLLREMYVKNSGFFSATDADSEGEEGQFFIWSITELKNIFNKNEFNQFNNWFDLSSKTDFENKHIIHFKDVVNVNESSYLKIDKLIKKLYKHRVKRAPPLTDYKILLSWNALLIPSLLEAGEVFDEQKYTNKGIDLANYLHSAFNKDGQLYRVSINSKLETPAIFEDYAYLARAYLSIYDYTNDKKWLKRVNALVKVMNDKFWDESEGGFNINDISSNNTKYINVNYKQGYDGAIISPNGAMYGVLAKLYNRVNAIEYKDNINSQMTKLLNAFSTQINRSPNNYSAFILGINNRLNGEVSVNNFIYGEYIYVNSSFIDNQLLINIDMLPPWHINSNKPLQKSLIATEIINIDKDIWEITDIVYPKAEVVSLSFSKKPISVYQGKVQIKAKLKLKSKKYQPPSIKINLQACSDKTCLAPTSIIVKP